MAAECPEPPGISQPLHLEPEVRQRVESDLIRAANLGVSRGRGAIVHNAGVGAVAERAHHGIHIPCIFGADMFLHGRESRLLWCSHDLTSLPELCDGLT